MSEGRAACQLHYPLTLSHCVPDHGAHAVLKVNHIHQAGSAMGKCYKSTVTNNTQNEVYPYLDCRIKRLRKSRRHGSPPSEGIWPG